VKAASLWLNAQTDAVGILMRRMSDMQVIARTNLIRNIERMQQN